MPVDVDLKISADQLNEESDTPLYQQIYGLIRKSILSGEVASKSRLPAEQVLIERLGVSRITVKRAFDELALAGLVRRHRGKGTIVAYDATAAVVKGSFDNLIDGLKRMGLETEVELLSSEMMNADSCIAESLGLVPGDSVQQIVRLRRLDGEPFSYLITFVPEDVAAEFSKHDLATQNLLELLEKSGHSPVSADQTIMAASAAPDVASALGLNTGAPILRIHRIMRDRNGRSVQDVTAHYRADRFHYQMHLTRDDPESDWMTK